MSRPTLRTGLVVCCSLLYLLALAAAPATAAERLYDRDVEKLIDRANNDLGKFLGNMKGDAKGAKVTRAGVETDVSDYLADFKAEGGRLNDRFGPDSAASPTALAFLQKAKYLDGFIDRHPGFTGADKEWAALRPTLDSLAGAYQIDWAGDPESWRPVRSTDAEVAGLAKQLDADLKGYAAGLSKAAKEAKLDSAARKGLETQAKALTGGAKALQKALSSRSPASNALGSLVSGVNGVSDKAASLGLGSSAVDAAAPLQATLGKLSTAIGS
jgi:hypothetical protein